MSSLIAYNKHLSTVANLDKLWELYHVWFTLGKRRNPEENKAIFKEYPRLLRGVITRKALYKELRHRSMNRFWTWRRYQNEKRVDIFSDVFFVQTRVCVEFGRRLVLSYIN